MLWTIAIGSAFGLIAGAAAGLVGKRRNLLVYAPAGALIGALIGALAAAGPKEVQAIAGHQEFDQKVLSSEAPVLVDFHAEWCGACKQLAPTIESLTAEFAGKILVVKIDVDQAPQLASRYRIRALPTVLLFVDGQEVRRWIGVYPGDDYRKSLEAALRIR